MVEPNGSDKACGEIPIFQKSRAQFRMLRSEDLLLGFQERAMALFQFCQKQLIGLASAEHKDCLAYVVQKPRRENQRRIIVLISGKQFSRDRGGDGMFPELLTSVRGGFSGRLHDTRTPKRPD